MYKPNITPIFSGAFRALWTTSVEWLERISASNRLKKYSITFVLWCVLGTCRFFTPFTFYLCFYQRNYRPINTNEVFVCGWTKSFIGGCWYKIFQFGNHSWFNWWLEFRWIISDISIGINICPKYLRKYWGKGERSNTAHWLVSH